ncbi:MAG: CvpA family protein [Candidatus Cryptobacteroides sp.]
MNVIDIIILVCCIPPLVKGISRGFVSQAASLLALVLGVWLSFKFSVPVGEWLKEYLELPGPVIGVASFALILLAVVLGLNLLAGMAEKVMEFVMLGWLNSLLGAAFALLKAVLVLGLVFLLLTTLNSTFELIPRKYFDESMLYEPVKGIADIVFPYIKELIFSK